MANNRNKASKAPAKAPQPIFKAYRTERVDYITWRLVEVTFQGLQIINEELLAEDLKGIVTRKLQQMVAKDA